MSRMSFTTGELCFFCFKECQKAREFYDLIINMSYAYFIIWSTRECQMMVRIKAPAQIGCPDVGSGAKPLSMDRRNQDVSRGSHSREGFRLTTAASQQNTSGQVLS
jgi:hypothetical protein